VFLLISRFISSNSADAGSSSFAATEVLAFFRIRSEPSACWPEAGTSGFGGLFCFAIWVDGGVSGFMMIGEGSFSSTEALSLPGPADDGFAVFAATAVVLAGFVGLCVAVDFGFAAAGLAVNGAGSSSAGGSATAIL
jgi:hypothetical protein